jgi:hypothetical protein
MPQTPLFPQGQRILRNFNHEPNKPHELLLRQLSVVRVRPKNFSLRVKHSLGLRHVILFIHPLTGSRARFRAGSCLFVVKIAK